MIFNEHSTLKGAHAFLSPSSYHWLNYTDEHLIDRYETIKAAEKGTRLHEFASEAIELGIRLPNNRTTLSMYVNDAIGYRMTPEQTLFYSIHCFGTADAISFRKNKLRIHDLKTGVTKTSELQLFVYAALFCLEYGYKPFDISYELRIYQSNEVRIFEPDPEEIARVMDKIIHFDKLIQGVGRPDRS